MKCVLLKCPHSLKELVSPWPVCITLPMTQLHSDSSVVSLKENKLFTSKWIEVKQNSTNIITQDIWPYIVL